MIPSLLREAGQALFGRQWQTYLANELGVWRKSIQRWDKGSAEMPADMVERLGHLCAERGKALAALARRLRG